MCEFGWCCCLCINIQIRVIYVIETLPSVILIDKLNEKIVNAAKESLGDRLSKIILYGSYARNEHNDESDIDYMILADIPQEDAGIWDAIIYKRVSEIELEHNIIFSAYVTNLNLFNGYVEILPYYSNIDREGIVIYAA